MRRKTLCPAIAGGRRSVITGRMGKPATINPRIVEGLYCEALVLSDEVRHAFTLGGTLSGSLSGTPPRAFDRPSAEDPARIALSAEGLRTTTRMMHAIAWLLNHRAHLMGELSEFQLRRHGRLSAELGAGDPAFLALLPSTTRDLVNATQRFYERLLRLDRAWRHTAAADEPGAVARLRERVERRMAG